MIRPYNSSDAEAVIEVWFAAASIAYHFVPEAFWRTEREDLEQKYLPLAETWVYERDGKVVAFLSLLGSEVGGLFVLPSCQSQGIGTALIQHAKVLRGGLSLDVFKRNEKSREFYEKCGFVVTKESLHDPTGCLMLTMQNTMPSSQDHYK